MPLLVLAMGKLGGGELNFSSDVDLVFLYPDAAVAAIGEASDEPSEPKTYYLRVAQLLSSCSIKRRRTGSCTASTCACDRSARAGRS